MVEIVKGIVVKKLVRVIINYLSFIGLDDFVQDDIHLFNSGVLEIASLQY